MADLPAMHRLDWSAMVPGASSSGHVTVAGDPTMPSTLREVIDHARLRLVGPDADDLVLVEIFDPAALQVLYRGRVGPEPTEVQLDRRLLALFVLPDRSTLQVLETPSDGYRLARVPFGAELDPDGSRYFGSAGAAIAAALELAEIDLPTPTQEDQPHE